MSEYSRLQRQDSVVSSRATMMERDLVTMEVVGESGPVWFTGYLRPCLAELFAVMLFVFVGTMSVQLGTPVGVAMAHGFAIALLIACIGPIR